MNMERYHFEKRNDRFYTFISEGPNGIISKAVEYSKLPELETEAFNLTFGDLNKRNNLINDLSTSNNLDKDKILATVGATLIDFMEGHPKASILAGGSTPSRTRLYQIGISKNLDEIKINYEIYGLLNDIWYKFQKGINYNHFLLKNK